MLASRYVKNGVRYHEAISKWLEAQRDDLVFMLVQYQKVELGHAPRVYVARPCEIAESLRSHRNGQGHGALQEDWKRNHPRSQYIDKIPEGWRFTQKRIDEI
jgi:hypothetical protein